MNELTKAIVPEDYKFYVWEGGEITEEIGGHPSLDRTVTITLSSGYRSLLFKLNNSESLLFCNPDCRDKDAWRIEYGNFFLCKSVKIIDLDYAKDVLRDNGEDLCELALGIAADFIGKGGLDLLAA